MVAESDLGFKTKPSIVLDSVVGDSESSHNPHAHWITIFMPQTVRELEDLPCPADLMVGWLVPDSVNQLASSSQSSGQIGGWIC
jgi:hypothetical protein